MPGRGLAIRVSGPDGRLVNRRRESAAAGLPASDPIGRRVPDRRNRALARPSRNDDVSPIRGHGGRRRRPRRGRWTRCRPDSEVVATRDLSRVHAEAVTDAYAPGWNVRAAAGRGCGVQRPRSDDGSPEPAPGASLARGTGCVRVLLRTCHGRDGKGNGPVASALKVAPADLTRLARRNGGAFPRQRVEAFITNGGDVLTPAHGNSDMPVWGPIFRALEPSGTLVKVRIANVAAYIESMQAK